MKIQNNLTKLCKEYRKELFEKFLEIGQGHPGSVFSMIEIVVTLYHKNFVRFNDKKNQFQDKVIISKGHATVALYPILKNYGIIPNEAWNNWGKKNSSSILRVFGNTSIPGIDATTGSLGHGLGVGCGMAYLYKKQNIDKKVYVIISEGELYEGSTWESLLFASHHSLDNLNIIIDVNSLIILGSTKECINLDSIEKKLGGYNFLVKSCDGHDIDQISDFLETESDKCKLLIANTIKGKGFSIMENKANWHYWNRLNDEQIEICRNEIK